MQYVHLGTTGLEVSRLVLGCMSFGDPKHGPHPGRWMRRQPTSDSESSGGGINLFDTANVYSAGSSEEIVGRALKDFGDATSS